jgi:hypothetical protein
VSILYGAAELEELKAWSLRTDPAWTASAAFASMISWLEVDR